MTGEHRAVHRGRREAVVIAVALAIACTEGSETDDSSGSDGATAADEGGGTEHGPGTGDGSATPEGPATDSGSATEDSASAEDGASAGESADEGAETGSGSQTSTGPTTTGSGGYVCTVRFFDMEGGQVLEETMVIYMDAQTAADAVEQCYMDAPASQPAGSTYFTCSCESH